MSTTLKSRAADRDEVRWAAVVARDAAADGQFVYGVSSTGVYCRPRCPSRRPQRDRVAFFDTAAEAERAGFRACRRCQPDRGESIDPWIEKVRRACAHLSSVEGPVSLAALARRIGGSPYHLHRNFKRVVGVTPREYADACRLQRVRRRLRRAPDVTTAVMGAGYGSSSRFYERIVLKLGMAPALYRRGGATARIHFAIVASPLGRLLVAATSCGICRIAIGASDGELERALAAEYPKATIERDDDALEQWTSAVVGLIAGREPKRELPLDVQATAFQRQVWQALGRIPWGETRSYGEVAAAIGRPRAVRAVARACATNPVAIVIPCHRVLPASGGLGGYRWGVERKRRLLTAERRATLGVVPSTEEPPK
jgi:AraC family transcriptional regulator of adaptative response/methylated-DNA-[protein]-cysteine methyltransferase